MVEEAARHLVDEELHDPASYLTIRRGDRVYDLFGWAAGRVAECRIAATRDELFDGVVVLGLTVADLARAGDRSAAPRQPADAAARDDAVALMAALSRMYAADSISLATLERDIERVLEARTCADLDTIAGELLPVPPG